MRRALVLVLALAGATPHAFSQGALKIPTVVFCEGYGQPHHVLTAPFIEGMRKRGWIDGQNVRIVIPEGAGRREGRLHQTCVDKLSDKRFDVRVEASRADPKSPVPIVTSLRRVTGSPLARSTTRNVTGISIEEEGMGLPAKRMALLKEAFGVERIVFVHGRPSAAALGPGLGTQEHMPVELREVAKVLGVTVAPLVIVDVEHFDTMFKALTEGPRTGLVFDMHLGWYEAKSNGASFETYLRKHRLPAIFPGPDFVREYPAAAMGYGLSMADQVERYSYFVDRILRGAKPSELPFEHMPYRLAVRPEEAKAIGSPLPGSILLQADIVVR